MEWSKHINYKSSYFSVNSALSGSNKSSRQCIYCRFSCSTGKAGTAHSFRCLLTGSFSQSLLTWWKQICKSTRGKVSPTDNYHKHTSLLQKAYYHESPLKPINNYNSIAMPSLTLLPYSNAKWLMALAIHSYTKQMWLHDQPHLNAKDTSEHQVHQSTTRNRQQARLVEDFAVTGLTFYYTKSMKTMILHRDLQMFPPKGYITY